MSSVIFWALRCLKDFFTQWDTLKSLLSRRHSLYCPLPRVPKSGEMSSWRSVMSENSQSYFHLQMNLYALSVASLIKGKNQTLIFFIQSSNTINKEYISSFYTKFFPLIIVNIDHFRYIYIKKKILFMQIRSVAVTGTENQ